jgi:hypothetical protein
MDVAGNGVKPESKAKGYKEVLLPDRPSAAGEKKRGRTQLRPQREQHT